MKKTVLIIMIIYYSFIIWSFSAQPAVESAGESRNITGFLYDKIAVHIKMFGSMGKAAFISTADKFVRKCAHFALYFVFSLIIYAYVNCFERNDLITILLVFLVGVIFAVSDEIHQLFVEGRGGQLRDVLIDSSGIMLGGGLSSCIKNIIRRSVCR